MSNQPLPPSAIILCQTEAGRAHRKTICAKGELMAQAMCKNYPQMRD